MFITRALGVVAALLIAVGCENQDTGSPPMNATMPEGMNKYPYLASDGGPHMLLPTEVADAWAGVSLTLPVLDPRSDYGRACAATTNTRMGVIQVGSSSALVFADPPMTAWGTSADGLAEIYYLQHWTGMHLDTLIDRATAALPTPSLTDTGKVLRLHRADAFLLYAGDIPGNPACGVHRVTIPAGSYSVLAGSYSAGGESVTVYRLKPIVRRSDTNTTPPGEKHAE